MRTRRAKVRLCGVRWSGAVRRAAGARASGEGVLGVPYPFEMIMNYEGLRSERRRCLESRD